MFALINNLLAPVVNTTNALNAWPMPMQQAAIIGKPNLFTRGVVT